MKKSNRKPQGATRTSVVQEPVRRPISELLSLPLKLLKVTAIFGVLAVIVLGGQRLLDSLDQPITRIEVTGELMQIDEAVIANWVQGQITEGVLRTDLNNLQIQLQARPWVARAAVRRKWPGVLHISLQEHVPVARWNEKALLTAQGLVFEPQQLPMMDDAPLLMGVDSSSREVLRQFARLQAELAELSFRVVSVKKSERGAWLLQLLSVEALAAGVSDQEALIEVALGKQELAAKLERFKNLYHSVLKVKINEIERVDLRYTNGVAVQWKTAPTVS